MHYSKIAKESLESDILIKSMKQSPIIDQDDTSRIKANKREKMFIECESPYAPNSEIADEVTEDAPYNPFVKFIDLSRFKIEKCRNMLTGK